MTLEQDVAQLQRDMRRALATVAALQGQPADATLSIPHNDTWPFEDNVDGAGGFAGNLRYVIASNVQRVASARLTMHLAAYRTYNSLTFSATGGESAGHAHASAAHAHQALLFNANVGDQTAFSTWDAGNGAALATLAQSSVGGTHIDTYSTTPGSTGAQSADHTHPVAGSAVLGITEGTVAAGVTISFDGVDATANLGGPFSVDVVELNVLPYLLLSKGVIHTIAMKSSGLGRIEAHLRLGVYVAAGSQF